MKREFRKVHNGARFYGKKIMSNYGYNNKCECSPNPPITPVGEIGEGNVITVYDDYLTRGKTYYLFYEDEYNEILSNITEIGEIIT